MTSTAPYPAVIFLGPPGSGKGTQCRFLTETFSAIQLSTGDMLREIVKSTGSPLGQHIRATMAAGQLVSDGTINELVAANLQRCDGHPVLFDGYPRTVVQAEALTHLLEEHGRDVAVVLNFEIAEELLVGRIAKRRVCPVCNAVFHLVSKPPLRDGVCDACGAALVHREDDTEQAVRSRFRSFQLQTAPVLSFYADRKIPIATVNGATPIEVVRSEIAGIVGQYL